MVGMQVMPGQVITAIQTGLRTLPSYTPTAQCTMSDPPQAVAGSTLQ